MWGHVRSCDCNILSRPLAMQRLTNSLGSANIWQCFCLQIRPTTDSASIGCCVSEASRASHSCGHGTEHNKFSLSSLVLWPIATLNTPLPVVSTSSKWGAFYSVHKWPHWCRLMQCHTFHTHTLANVQVIHSHPTPTPGSGGDV